MTIQIDRTPSTQIKLNFRPLNFVGSLSSRYQYRSIRSLPKEDRRIHHEGDHEGLEGIKGHHAESSNKVVLVIKVLKELKCDRKRTKTKESTMITDVDVVVEELCHHTNKVGFSSTKRQHWISPCSSASCPWPLCP
ncbi:hypothetical protein E2542_SST16343 [Spatholobus suberectus]|nr:hypothetical protein E2542_SST16343 [Spatholobus suberectus]